MSNASKKHVSNAVAKDPWFEVMKGIYDQYGRVRVLKVIDTEK